jgi:hypothetical protein
MSPVLHFVPRLRRPMESLDLGLSLLQAHRGVVYQVFLLQLVIVLALLLPFTWKQPVWTLLILWWLMPWFHRGTLHVLARRVFGQDASVFTFLEQWRSIHRRGLLATLLWRRLSTAASFLLPIWQLEDQGGSAYVSRARLLRRQGGGMAFLLALICFLLSVLTILGILGLLQMMVPKSLTLDLWEALGRGFDRPWFAWCFTVFGLLTFTLIEPFYAAAGFALYLNRRTQLEGWDLEQSFRRLAARLRSVGRGLLLLLVLGAGLGVQRLGAAPATPPAKLEEEPKPLRPLDPARKVLEDLQSQDPDLRRTRDKSVLRFKSTGKEPAWVRRFLEWWDKPREEKREIAPQQPRNWLKPLAFVIKVLMVAALVALVIFVILRFRHKLRDRQVSDDYEAPEALAGLDVRPESLPPDVAGEALIRFQTGDRRGAMALLYRGALTALIHGHRLEIPSSATEGDCLRMALPKLTEEAGGTFRLLTRIWIRMAYLGEDPDTETMEILCIRWRAAFGGVR